MQSTSSSVAVDTFSPLFACGPWTAPPRLDPVETVREMVENVETLTAAGQRHMMGKVAGFIVAELRRFHVESGGPVSRSLARTLEKLANEPERPAPAVRPFKRRAEILLTVLQRAGTRAT